MAKSVILVSVALKRPHLGPFHATMEGWVVVDGGVIPKAVWGGFGGHFECTARSYTTARWTSRFCESYNSTLPQCLGPPCTQNTPLTGARGNLLSAYKGTRARRPRAATTHTHTRERQSLSTGKDGGGGERARSWSGRVTASRVTIGQHTSASALPRRPLPSSSPAQLRKRDTSVDGEVCALRRAREGVLRELHWAAGSGRPCRGPSNVPNEPRVAAMAEPLNQNQNQIQNQNLPAGRRRRREEVFSSRVNLRFSRDRACTVLLLLH